MKIITISDHQDLSVSLLAYGARITRIQFAELDVALGYASIEEYFQDPYYMGATVGPICNRIGDATLCIESERFRLPANEANNCLHSGGKGLDKERWAINEVGPSHVVFGLNYDLTKIGMHGMLECLASYTVANGGLTIEYTTNCDQTTYVNLTNHVYLNLSGTGSVIGDHSFTLNADFLLNVDEQKLPNGTLTKLPNPCHYRYGSDSADGSLSGGPFGKPFGGPFGEPCDYHFNALDQRMAQVSSASSGLKLAITSNLPGFQFYTGTFLSEPFAPASGFCIETQYPPDAINQADLEAPLLHAGQTRTVSTHYQFSNAELLA